MVIKVRRPTFFKLTKLIQFVSLNESRQNKSKDFI